MNTKHTNGRTKGKQHQGRTTSREKVVAGGLNGAWLQPQTIAASPRNVEQAPMQYDGGERHTPHTQQIPHCIPRATNLNTHRDHHLSPQQPSELREAREASKEPPRIHTTSQHTAYTTYPSSPTDVTNPQHHPTLFSHLTPMTKHRPLRPQ